MQADFQYPKNETQAPTVSIESVTNNRIAVLKFSKTLLLAENFQEVWDPRSLLDVRMIAEERLDQEWSDR